jgi:uncharacterized integral membrane protein
MLNFIKYLIYLLVAALIIAFAVANHEPVTVSLDPLSTRENAAYSFDAPMFVLLLVCVMIGIVIGGWAVWFGQGRHRRAARQLRSETTKLKADIEAAEAKLPAKLARRA